MTILTPEMRQALEAAGWVFESPKRCSKVGDPVALDAEWVAITGQPTDEPEENEWFHRRDGQPGLVWDITNICECCGCYMASEYDRFYGICCQCA